MRYQLLVARKQAGYTQEQIASMLEIPQYKYSKIECGKQVHVDVVLADAIARLLNTSIEELFLSSYSQKMRKEG